MSRARRKKTKRNVNTEYAQKPCSSTGCRLPPPSPFGVRKENEKKTFGKKKAHGFAKWACPSSSSFPSHRSRAVAPAKACARARACGGFPKYNSARREPLGAGFVLRRTFYRHRPAGAPTAEPLPRPARRYRRAASPIIHVLRTWRHSRRRGGRVGKIMNFPIGRPTEIRPRRMAIDERETRENKNTCTCIDDVQYTSGIGHSVVGGG